MMNLKEFLVKHGGHLLLVALCCLLLLCACKMPAAAGNLSANGRGVPFDPDLHRWKTASLTPFAVSDTIAAFAYGTPGGADRYVAAAKSGVIAWSNDGDIWHRAKKAPDEDPDVASPDPFNASFNAVAWGGGVFVAAGNGGKIARSADGVNWTAGPAAGISGFGANNIMGVAYGNGFFVAVGGNASIARSADGIAWLPCNDNDFNPSQLNDIAYSAENGRFYIVGDDGKRGWTDNPESRNWHYIAPAAPAHTNPIRKVTVGRYGGGIGIGIAFNEWDNKRTAIATNSDFGNFDADLHTGNFGNNTINGIAWGGGYFAAAGQAAMIGWWPSAEPANVSQRYWRALSFTEFRWWEISALAACKDRFFIGNLGGKIGYSK